ncbi:MAG: thiamine pyrophosphate-dependent dehydrogenase E1 component subunit alpha [Chloroflexi bacterium]|nr:thiamine pyrophosphate-dependent dehydrogenase E1 component subunit alpha [Chloroflexota bacterium]
MLLTRIFDDRITLLSHQGRVGISASARGHEAAQVASAWAVRPGQDVVYPYYRDIGVVFTLGITPYDLFLGALNRAGEPFSGARQMPFHFTSPSLRMPTPSTSIATHIPHAVGAALAAKIRREDAVIFCWFGDGATSKGDFHEGISFAAIHKLPIVFICENNQYAISVPVARQLPTASVAERAAGYGIPTTRCDGLDVPETYRIVVEAVQRAQAGAGPSLIETLVYRLGPHTSHDDDSRYRTREEVAAWEAREPIGRLRADLCQRGLLDEAADAVLLDSVREEIAQALTLAELAPEPDPATAFTDILAGRTVPNPFERSSSTLDSASRQSGEGIHATGTRG